MVYFEVDATDSDVRGAEPVYAGDQVVGVTTSGGYGHRTGKSLGFATIRPGSHGTSLEVKLLGERHAITVLDQAAYDPSNSCLKS